MLERNGGIIRAVAWLDICPWLAIFRTFRLAIGFRALVMAAVAVFITVIGWSMFGRIFSITEDTSASTDWLKPYADSPLENMVAIVPDEPVFFTPAQTAYASQSLRPMIPSDITNNKNAAATLFLNPMSYTLHYLNQPLREGLSQEVHPKSVICLILCGLWSLAVWAFFGAAICRIASVQLATSEQ